MYTFYYVLINLMNYGNIMRHVSLSHIIIFFFCELVSFFDDSW